MWLDFVYLSTFDRNAQGILSDDDLVALEDRLLLDPEQGTLIPGTGGVRKIRVPLHARGKSGGARVLYYYISSDTSVYFLNVYRKSVKETLTAGEKSALHSLAKRLKGT